MIKVEKWYWTVD